MSPRLGSFAIRFYNFSSILCLKLENQTFQVSASGALFNTFKLPLVLCSAFYVLLHGPLRDEILKKQMIDMNDFSELAKVTIIVATFLAFITSQTISILQVLFRHKMKKLLNELMRYQLSDSYFAKLRKFWISDFIEFSLFLITKCIIQAHGTSKLSAPTFLYISVYFYINLVLIAFVSFCKSYENFFIMSLRDLKNTIKCCKNSDQIDDDVEYFIAFSRQYQRLFNLAQRFNRACGLQMTIVTCYLTIVLTFGVRMSCNSLIIIQFYFSNSFSIVFNIRPKLRILT